MLMYICSHVDPIWTEMQFSDTGWNKATLNRYTSQYLKDSHKNPVVSPFPIILVLKDVSQSTGNCLTPSNNNQKYGGRLTFFQEVDQGYNLWTGQSHGIEHALDVRFRQIGLILIFCLKCHCYNLVS